MIADCRFPIADWRNREELGKSAIANWQSKIT